MAVQIVQSGDTLSEIAAANNMSLARLLELNPNITNPDLIHPGDRINIGDGPGGPGPGPGGGGGPRELNQVPPMDAVWRAGDTVFLVRFNDRVQPRIPMVWAVRSPEDFEALGIGKVDRTFASVAEMNQTGALRFGSTLELVNTTEDPAQQIYSNYRTEARVKPWLRDPEILTLWMQAALEGRSITDAELQGSEWWRSHSEAERQWISLNASDPETANRLIRDNRLQVSELFRQAGVSNASRGLIETVADKWTTGAWTEAFAVNQIRLLADPAVEGRLAPVLRGERRGLDRTREGEEEVQDMVATWLGPAHAWEQNRIRRWAGKLRTDPDARLELEELLSRQRLALFPEYDNPNLTYDDIAGPWRGLVQQVWGHIPDETDPLFTKIVRLNDAGEATRLLRRQGLSEGNELVRREFLSGLGVFGGQIRRSDPAVF